VNLGHYILAVDEDGRPSRGAQRDVQDGASFRDVDLLAPEHRVNLRTQGDCLRQIEQELDRF